ncbi:next to BRCA1 gene 1 protein isoform X2 [Thamnophis elegans]|uniref:next to BRCA1 gene 1 protein isoform X2 n=1 Tax=Thamnophis elegans TaxID=35005 RepID=UPI0013777B33|nr:next to BRCA1 gene 1 protein isoform X2 [Thamnophis elegans]
MANAERGTLVFPEVHSSDVQDLLGSPIRRMDPQVNFSVNFQGNTLTFLVSSKTTWADMEAMVKVSFELNNIQIKYIDEDHDEVSINTAEEYQEAVKIAMKQGSRLQMNVYELRVPSGMSSRLIFGRSEELFVPEVKKKAPIAPTLIKDKDTKRKNKRIQFREQVVQDTVKMLEQKLNDKLLLTNQFPKSMNTSRHQTPASSLVQGNSYDWLLSCNNCQKPIVGIRYQCSVCPTYNICELCEAGLYFHDPNHVFLKLRRPTWHISDTQSLGQRSSSLVTSEQARFQMDKNFLKAEKQRLRGEKKQRKAEARELKKQLKLHQKFNLWNSVHALDHRGLAAAKSERLQSSTLLSLQRCPVVSTLSAAFVDENLPDGSHLPPKIIFMKHWRMRNTGNMAWSSDTKLKFMWGNITLMSSEKKDVIVPSLLPGEEGFVSVEFEAPATEGTYASHWRLSHKGEQFGPRIWCSIVVDSSSSTISNLSDHGRLMPSCCQNSRSLYKEEERASEFKGEVSLANRVASSKMKKILNAREFYIPSLDLLTAQDLLSFELLDINIVQELEQVPHNTPVDSIQGPSPCKIHECTSLPKTTVLDQKQEANERITYKLLSDAQVSKGKAENSGNQEEGEEDMSGTQFVCETVIRSLTLDAAPDHQPPQKKKSFHNSLQTLSDIAHCSTENNDPINPVSVSEELRDIVPTSEFENLPVQDGEESNIEADNDTQDEFSSQASSLSEDFIIVLPECFDTSRPLGESMYSSALSQSNLENVTMAPANPEESHTSMNSTSDMLITSQTLDEVSLTPQSGEPRLIRFRALSESSQEASEEALLVPVQMREELQRYESEVSSPENINNPSMYPESSRHSPGNSLAGGLVKGALSVAASAYKALFVGQAPMDQAVSVTSENQMASFLTHLHEMGFCDRHLNLHLLQKHKCDMNLVVTELLKLNQGDWYGNPY